MDLSKSYDYFKPELVKERIHIIGCGSVGSAVAVLLTRAGLTKLTLWDFDTVEEKNVANQMYTQNDIGERKTDALADILCGINPDIGKGMRLKPEGYTDQQLSGYVFLCADDIELRAGIVKAHMDNPNVKAMFDFRTRLEDAQHYAADWSNYEMKQNLLRSMNFTNQEADETTQRSACGGTLGVASTVWLIASLGVNNFLNFVRKGEIKKMVLMDGFNFTLDAF